MEIESTKIFKITILTLISRFTILFQYILILILIVSLMLQVHKLRKCAGNVLVVQICATIKEYNARKVKGTKPSLLHPKFVNFLLNKYFYQFVTSFFTEKWCKGDLTVFSSIIYIPHMLSIAIDATEDHAPLTK